MALTSIKCSVCLARATKSFYSGGSLRTSSIRVLVVDDFAPWRRLVPILLNKAELQVVGEASDGLEAIREAEELQPDLILLDIRLPKLNGIEAAYRIRGVAPKSKILFVSESDSVDVAKEALRAGGSGYVIKSDAGAELLAAVEAVVRGKGFISGRLADALTTQAFDRLKISEILASFSTRLPRNQGATVCHEVQFYSDDARCLNRLTRFVGAALEAGSVVTAFATAEHRPTFVEGLQADGLDVRAAMQAGLYRVLDVKDALSSFMVQDSIDPIRYLEALAALVESSLKVAPGGRVAACGELAARLLEQGNHDAALQIEHLSNEFAKQYGLDILCLYPVTSYPDGAGSIFQRICAEHATVYYH